ncbi:hypothetical protein AMS70_16210 [Acinetobacter sp. JS678]|nr:hypothetical protein AMS70_16210 [Acinetobacter sp. JS678]
MRGFEFKPNEQERLLEYFLMHWCEYLKCCMYCGDGNLKNSCTDKLYKFFLNVYSFFKYFLIKFQ